LRVLAPPCRVPGVAWACGVCGESSAKRGAARPDPAVWCLRFPVAEDANVMDSSNSGVSGGPVIGHPGPVVAAGDAVAGSVPADRATVVGFDDMVVAPADKYKVCARPYVLRQVDIDTGATEYVPVPCGHTLERVCVPCARKNLELRRQQCREGWFADTEPVIEKPAPTEDQVSLSAYRADLVAAYRQAVADDDPPGVLEEFRTEVAWCDGELRKTGMRGKLPPLDPVPGKARARRSTKRRQDAPDLPRRSVARRSVGQLYNDKYRPSTFLTLTLPGYGPVTGDHVPVNPATYDYRRAALDIAHLKDLWDRFIDALRRALGWHVEYFCVMELQQRGTPHLHALLRGSMPTKLVKQVISAIYFQLWWPRHDRPVYEDGRLPYWDADARTFRDPGTGAKLTTWDEAMAALNDPDAEPAYVARFGVQSDTKPARGVLGGTPEAERHIGYITKYMTKAVSDTLHADTVAQQRHHDRLHEELQHTPCSPRCPVWLRFGVVPQGATRRSESAVCKGKLHNREYLGLPGRRVLVSRRWTGKKLADHRNDRMRFVKQLLEDAGLGRPAPAPGRYVWLKVEPGDRNLPPRGHLLLVAVARRASWRAEYERALGHRAAHPPGGADPAGCDTGSGAGVGGRG
jgi:hypothetical protein